MPHAKHRVLLTIVLAVLVLPAAAQDATPPRRLALEAISPHNTMAFASFAGIDACSKAAEGLGLYDLFAHPQTQAFLSQLIGRYNELAAQTPAEFQGPWDMLKGVFSGRVAFALTGLSIATDSTIPVMPSAVVALDISSNPNATRDLVAMTLNQMQPMLDQQGITHEVKPFKEVDVHVYKVNFGGLNFAFCYAYLENLLLVSVGQGPIRKCINFSKRESPKTLATSPLFQRCRNRSKGDTLVEFYAGIDAIKRRFKLLIPNDILEQIDASGFGGANALYLASAIHGGDSFDTIYLDAPAPRSGMLALDGGRPLSPKTLDLIPPDALAFVALRCDFATAWDTAWTSFASLGGPEMAVQGQGMVAAVERELGFSLRGDILAALGHEFAIYAEMPRDLRVPKIVASIEVRDREKASALIGALLTQIPANFRTIEHRDHTIHMAAPRGWQNFPGSPCYTLTADRLLVSPTRSGIEEALDRLDHVAQQSPGIAAASASFRACVKGMPWDKSSAIWWIDTKRVLGFAYEAAYDILPGITPDSLPIDITRMPPAKTFLAHMSSLGGVGYSDKDGLVFQCRTIGFASALAIAARIVDRAPGAAPWVLERMMDSFR
ncbi:MAG: hypothetical protein CMJ90_04840 [Planctomycetes bacterium]|nr:hypothetical protein [Planctomycetota bacterium]